MSFGYGTLHKRRLLGGVGRWGPPKGDLRRRGVDSRYPDFSKGDVSFFGAHKASFQGNKDWFLRGDFNFGRQN